jgi:hypothetical protein
MLKELAYFLSMHWCHHISSSLLNTWQYHIQTEHILMPPQHQQRFIQYSTRSHTSYRHNDATTLTQVYQILNEITYLLTAHWCHHISRGPSNTWQDHILSVGTLMPLHQQSSIKYLMRLHTCWGYINTPTSAELYQIPNKITHSLRAHWHCHVSIVRSKTVRDHIPPEYSSMATTLTICLSNFRQHHIPTNS